VIRRQAFFAKLNERVALALLFIYKRVLGPSMHAGVPGACCFQPTCSDYAAIAIAEHGVLRGAAMAAWRVLRCHPLSRGGFDPVPAKHPQSERFNREYASVLRTEWTPSHSTASQLTGPQSSGIR
jgi:uncharacterized protein